MLEHTMNFELYIENLGAIEKAEMTINPLTILAGENGTGKSFVTKFLYSVLNVLMKDFSKNELLKIINDLAITHNDLKLLMNETLYYEFNSFLNRVRDKILSSNIFNENFHIEILDILKFIDSYKSSLHFSYTLIDTNKPILELSRNITKDSIHERFLENKFYNMYYRAIISLLKKMKKNFMNISSFYNMQLEYNIHQELKSNFQISSLKQLIKKDREKLIFEIKNTIKIEIQKNVININQYNNIKNIHRLVFFESPIYWRLSRDLIENSHQPKNYYLSSEINDERLTGIPKHFLDLRELVFANFKHGERPKFIEQCADDLQKHLNGKFNTDSYDLSFETNQGQPIVKNLVSFGMTNLGIIQAVLSKNIINKGSFVFIDEPESNLHPEWQAVLADILVKLAENGVFVVITTHSSDMLKALDVISQEHKQHEDFTSVNYFEKGGILAELNQENISTVQQARLKLLETYDDLVLRGYLV